MKNSILSVFSLMLCLQMSATSANALVTFGPMTQKEIKGVKLSDSVKISDGGNSLGRLTQGLRQKKVVFAWFSVYVAQFFSTSAKGDFTSVEKLKDSLSKGYPLVVSMTFVRNVDIEKIVDGFNDVFKENEMDVTKTPYKEFLAAVKVGGDIKDRQNIFFAFDQANGKESFSVQTNGKEVFALKDQAPGSTTAFLNMWVGKAPDSGLEQLQDQLLKPNMP